MPEPISHDWHVQPSCQRPNRGPPRRCEFSPGESARKQIRLSSKLDKHTVLRKSRQSSQLTGFPDVFHIGKTGSGNRRAASRTRGGLLTVRPFGVTSLLAGRSKTARNRMVFRSEIATFGARRHGRQKIEKRSFG